MEYRAHFTEHRQERNEVQQLITPEMRQQIVEVQRQLEEYANSLADLFYELAEVRDAVTKAQAVAECLLAKNPFEGWQARKRFEEEEVDAFLRSSSMENWEPEIED